MAARQLALDLPHRPALEREDFLISSSNADAVAFIESWPHWPAPVAMLLGPPGSGKSHLVEVWRKSSRADVIRGFASSVLPHILRHGALAVEDLPGEGFEERELFHLINLAREMKASVLLTAREHHAKWGLRIPDLVSRLNAIPVAEIREADDALLRGVLLKLFSDRQIMVDEALLSYLVTRLPRSLEAAGRAVVAIDRLALEQGSAVNRSFVARILPQLIENKQLNLFIE
jgi:chromosomal replication initiation ATPase DnaA